MSTEPSLSAGIDPNRPSAARIYDSFLGGTHNFAADRAVAQRAIELVPELPRIMKANRAFLRRAVRFAAGNGIRQFLDLGSGIPTEGNVHEVAANVRSDARVVYVDLEPTAVLHARDILAGVPGTAAVRGDLQHPSTFLEDPQVRQILDFDEPMCILMIAVLHFVPDSAALTAALQEYRDLAASGSILVVSHATASARPDALARIADLYTRTGTPLVLRDACDLAAVFDGWEVLDPGIVYGPQWRPDSTDPDVDDPAAYITLAGVAAKSS